MKELPDELWRLIKDFQLDWKNGHKIKMNYILKYLINDRFSPVYQIWTLFPPPPMNDNLPLTSITWAAGKSYKVMNHGERFWLGGYGWDKHINSITNSLPKQKSKSDL